MSLSGLMKRRAPRMASVFAILRAIPLGWRKRGISKGRDYERQTYDTSELTPGHDLPVALAVRAALEGRYRVVAEIGAAAGGRIATVVP